MSRRWRDDRGSMPLAVMLSVTALAFTTLLASMLTRQIEETRSDVQRVQALSAAQAGLDVATANIFAAHDAVMQFVIEDLPDQDIDGSTGSGSYTVSFVYFDADPHGRDAQWRSANGGPLPGGATRYAVVTSVGWDGHDESRRRTLVATFAFPVAGTLLGGEARPRLLDVEER